MKKSLFILMILFITIMIGACTEIPDSQVDISVIQNKLDTLDAYKESLPDVKASEQDYDITDATFRGIYFGTSMDMVGTLETLPLSEQYSDALDYTGSGVYSYDMLLTYWFNSNDQLFSASYSMNNSELFETFDALMTGLQSDFGEPLELSYYDDSNASVTFDSQEQALNAVDNDGAYYYAYFVDDNGINIELYAMKGDTDYEFWVYYTDYSYYA